jgi:regulator of protease activity HflC (stomatin/prohibitin superfamily)
MQAIWIVGIIFLFIVLSRSFIIILPYQNGVKERLGKYVRTLNPGLNMIFPFIESVKKVDMRENVIDVPPQEVITQDNVTPTVDAIIYFQITDPFRVLYNVSNFEVAAIKLAQTNLRNIIGELELDQTLTSREMINTRLREVLDEATDRWGVRVTRVEIKKIDPPHDITEAMSRQMKAERTKRAAILDAEGIKQAAILEAEGKRQAAILEAEGKAEAVKKAADAEKYRLVEVANGEAQSIEMVFTAIHNGKPSNDLIAIRYLKTLEAMADGKANKMFIPYESSGIIGSLAQVAELFKKDSKAPVE